jgi:glutamate N-acetyltransferase/amino-acid N-acetyltransferase
LALIVAAPPDTTAAGVFTTNRVAAAPVQLSREHLKASRGRARAIVVNAGNANACTGAAGLRAGRVTAQHAARLIGTDARQILLASTGVIGVPLDAERIVSQLPTLSQRLAAEDADQVARAIMTTDTFPKSCVLRTRIGARQVHLAGIAKGAGMIHPKVATMLVFITTDAAVPPNLLQSSLRAAANASFNRITVDGDMSTNDTIFVLASGGSGVVVKSGSPAAKAFLDGLRLLAEKLALMIVRDGEGARKLVTVEVRGASGDAAAERVARAIANSPLVKTAIAGSDPNWGRIICAAGYSGAKFDPEKVEIRFNRLVLVRRGIDAGYDEAAARRELDGKDITIRLDLHDGKGSARIWTCDLTHDYITINASYRS